jgi:putative transposase
MVVAYLDKHRGQFGVGPACRVLSASGVPVAASTYYAAKKRPASARACRDAVLLAEITRVFKESGEVYGARKVWLQLRREHIICARCTVERLMAAAGLAGVRRGHRARTTSPPAGPPGRRTWSTATSQRRRQTGCGWWTSLMWRWPPAGSPTRRWSLTRSPG